MISKTKIKRKAIRKTHPLVREIVIAAYKNAKWMRIANMISGPTRKYASVNLSDLEEKAAAGDTFVVIGKVLGSGNLTKKIKVCALSFSSSAIAKMKKSKSETSSILDEVKNNPKAEGIKLVY